MNFWTVLASSFVFWGVAAILDAGKAKNVGFLFVGIAGVLLGLVIFLLVLGAPSGR